MRADYKEAGGRKNFAAQDKPNMLRKSFARLHCIFRIFHSIVCALNYIFLNRKEIFAYKFIAVSAGRTFGHDLQFFDVTARLYHPRKIAWIYVCGETHNAALLRAFERNITFFKLTGHHEHADWIANVIKAILSFAELKRARWPTHYIIDPRHLMQTLSVWEGNYTFAPQNAEKIEAGLSFLNRVPLSIYRFLILNGIGSPPKVPEELVTKCKEKITSKYPEFFEKPLVTLILRGKGYLGIGLNGPFRMSGPQENYREAVQFLGQNGFHIAGTGDTKIDLFKDIEGFFDLDCCGLDTELLNIFLILNCALGIGQNSGPHPLISSAGGAYLTTDAMPLAHAPLGVADIVLHKRIKLFGSTKSIAEIYRSYPHCVFSKMTFEPGLEVIDNTSTEILWATMEMVQRMNGKKDSAETIKLNERLRRLAPEGSMLKYYEARPPLFILEEMRIELLNDDKTA